MFAIITSEKQKAFESQATAAEKEKVPCICGYYGRACRQMDKDEGANRMLCHRCPLARFSESC